MGNHLVSSRFANVSKNPSVYVSHSLNERASRLKNLWCPPAQAADFVRRVVRYVNRLFRLNRWHER